MPIVFIIGIILIALMMIYDALTGSKKVKAQLTSEYGSPEWQEPLACSTHYYEGLPHQPLREIDEQTWRDLNLDEFYKKANHTKSMIGEAYLYKVLHTLSDEEELDKREKLIHYFHEHPNERLDAQYLLFLLGKVENTYLDSLPEDLQRVNIKGKTVFRVCAYLPILSLLLLPLSINAGIVLLFLTITFNVLLYLYADTRLSKIDYLFTNGGLMLKYGRMLTRLLNQDNPYYQELKAVTDSLKPLEKGFRGSSLKINTFDITFVFFIFKFIFISQARCFFRVRDLISKHQKEYLALYRLMGEIDVAISIDSYRQSLDYYCLPQFSNERTYKVTDLYHPLLTDPISNSLTMPNHIMLTGSNASGKSTFIKATGINAIMAQTIHTCFSHTCILRPSLVVSSMAIQDNIVNGESYFIAEIKSLKRMLDLLEQTPCFCLIDEILRGTNTRERISASISILDYLKMTDALCIVATHDIELTQHVAFLQYHFSEVISDNEVLFDYTLKEGICQSTNAIKLLKIYGFSDKILNTISLNVLK